MLAANVWLYSTCSRNHSWRVRNHSGWDELLTLFGSSSSFLASSLPSGGTNAKKKSVATNKGHAHAFTRVENACKKVDMRLRHSHGVFKAPLCYGTFAHLVTPPPPLLYGVHLSWGASFRLWSNRQTTPTINSFSCWCPCIFSPSGKTQKKHCRIHSKIKKNKHHSKKLCRML